MTAWSRSEVAFLKENSRAMPIFELASALNRSSAAVSRKLQRLGLAAEKRRRKGKAWSPGEIQFLRENYQQMTSSEIAKALHRPYVSIRTKLTQLQLTEGKSLRKEWTDEEIRFLKDKSKHMSIPEMAKALNRPDTSVYKKMKRLALKIRDLKPRWSSADLNYLEMNYRNDADTIEKIAVKLDRSSEAVYYQARLQDLHRITQKEEKGETQEEDGAIPQRSGRRKKWRKEDRDFLEANYTQMTLQEIADHLGASRHTVRRHLSNLLRSSSDRKNAAQKEVGWKRKRAQKVKSLKAQIRHLSKHFSLPLSTSETKRIQTGAYSMVDLLARHPYFRTIKKANLEVLAYAILAQQYQETKGNSRLPFQLSLKHRRNVLKRRMLLRGILTDQV